jgi:proteasome alpha subunit
MTMPFYSSVDQLLRDRSELARKGIARGRSVVVLTYSGGVLFVAENRGTSLRKVSEIYDRIGFAAVGRYNEFENLRTGGIRRADFRGFTYDRRDVSGRMLANAYAQALGTAFVEQQKPFEVELCVAEVGVEAGGDQLFRITYDGSITDEPSYVVMGGTTDPISARLKDTYAPGMDLSAAIGVAVQGLQAGGTPVAGAVGANGGSATTRTLGVTALEVAVLERSRPRRAFRRITGAALSSLLPEENRGGTDEPATGGEPG